ncbi:MAG: hypothetical protein M3304_13305 [Actinomycetota bacterium]|nr:hypothetical protein [Actinomycetota bacterium]
MSPLYLHCAICGRKQADGLLSRGHWGHIALADGTARHACPACKSANADWESVVVSASEGGVGAAYGTEYGVTGDRPSAY